jgi:hypothetical protein
VLALIETLGFRHIGVVHDEYAVSPDGMKMFGVLDLATEMEGSCTVLRELVSRRREIVMLYERWRWTLRSRLVGGGFKLP